MSRQFEGTRMTRTECRFENVPANMALSKCFAVYGQLIDPWNQSFVKALAQQSCQDYFVTRHSWAPVQRRLADASWQGIAQLLRSLPGGRKPQALPNSRRQRPGVSCRSAQCTSFPQHPPAPSCNYIAHHSSSTGSPCMVEKPNNSSSGCFQTKVTAVSTLTIAVLSNIAG